MTATACPRCHQSGLRAPHLSQPRPAKWQPRKSSFLPHHLGKVQQPLLLGKQVPPRSPPDICPRRVDDEQTHLLTCHPLHHGLGSHSSPHFPTSGWSGLWQAKALGHWSQAGPDSIYVSRTSSLYVSHTGDRTLHWWNVPRKKQMDGKQLNEYSSNKPTLTGINCFTCINSFLQQPYIASAVTMSTS